MYSLSSVTSCVCVCVTILFIIFDEYDSIYLCTGMDGSQVRSMAKQAAMPPKTVQQTTDEFFFNSDNTNKSDNKNKDKASTHSNKKNHETNSNNNIDTMMQQVLNSVSNRKRDTEEKSDVPSSVPHTIISSENKTTTTPTSKPAPPLITEITTQRTYPQLPTYTIERILCDTESSRSNTGTNERDMEANTESTANDDRRYKITISSPLLKQKNRCQNPSLELVNTGILVSLQDTFHDVEDVDKDNVNDYQKEERNGQVPLFIRVDDAIQINNNSSSTRISTQAKRSTKKGTLVVTVNIHFV